MIGYKNTISGGSSIIQPIRIPENMRNVILLMNLILTISFVQRFYIDRGTIFDAGIRTGHQKSSQDEMSHEYLFSL